MGRDRGNRWKRGERKWIGGEEVETREKGK